MLRRIMRRAMRHAQLLGARDPLMWRLVPALVREMGQAYPELVRGEALITETLKLEETRFRKTLARGLGLLSDATERLGAGDRLDGETAFKLYDTLRLPARPDAGRAAPARHCGRSRRLQRRDGAAEGRSARQLGGLRRGGDRDGLVRRARQGRRDRVSRLRHRKAEGIMRRWSRTARWSTAAGEGETVGIVVNQTPFYGESGGQMGDTGTISGEGFRSRSPTRRRRPTACSSIPARVVKGTVEDRRRGRAQGRSRAPHAAALEPFGDASRPRGAARSAGHACRAEGLAGGA